MSSQNRSVGISLSGIRPSFDSADIVIVGNGIAGLTAAVEARRLVPDKRIVIITEQSHPTINTPALKQFAINKLTREQLLAYPAGTERAQHIHVIAARVEAIQTQGKFVRLSGGQAFGYNSLLLATGSRAVGLPSSLPGRNFDGVLTLHRLSDYLDLRRRLPEVNQAVVIGGGTHAIETVRCLSHWGISVSWLIRSETFLPHMLDCPASDMILERIARTGVKVYTETEVVGIVGRVGTVVGVVTNTHKMLPCQLVITCTGTTPETSLAAQCDVPLAHKKGILVDDSLRTSIQDIYAAGDAAALKNPQTGTYEPRAQWYAAVLQGRVAGAMMTDHPESVTPFGVPWHATHVGGLSLLTVGNPLGWVEGAATLTDSSKGSYRRISLYEDRLIGYLSLGPMQPDGLAIKRLIDEGHPVRDIKKALLKGEFDAREYFSQQRVHAAHTMVTTGKLVASDFDRRTLAVTHAPRHTDALSHTTIHRALAQSLPPTDEEEEISPFTGNLPVPTTDSIAVPPAVIPVGAVPCACLGEETLLADDPSLLRMIESTLVSLPARTSHRDSPGLLSSVGAVPCACPKMPAIKLGRDPVVVTAKNRPSQKLLSYVARKENE